MAEDKDNLASLRQEMAELRQIIAEKEQTIQKLTGWLQNLYQDFNAIYHSLVWQVGETVVRFLLKVLHRPFDTTIPRHATKIYQDFTQWRAHYQVTNFCKKTDICPIWHDTAEYTQWFTQYRTQAKLKLTTKNPIISLLLMVDTAEESALGHTIESVQAQIYPVWELCIAYRELSPIFLQKYGNIDNRVKYAHIADLNHAPVALLNIALSMATGDFVAVMGVNDQLSEYALAKIAEILTNYPHIDLIYTDEDKLTVNGQRYDPFFKSDWNPDLFYSHNYLGYLVAYRLTLVKKLGGFQAVGADYDLNLRFIEQIPATHIYHIPEIVYHQRDNDSAPLSLSENSPRQLLQAHFQRLQQAVDIEDALPGHTRVRYPLPTPSPLVSLIIPTRDQVALLQVAVTGILENTDYSPFELIIVNNGSILSDTMDYFQEIQQDERVKIIHWDGPFNYSLLNNLGVHHASGDVIGLINNDIEVIHADWLREMVSQALRAEIGAVGAKLYYPDDTLQHAGLILGIGGLASYVLKYVPRENCGYHWKPFLVQNYSAVTGACLVMRRRLFVEMGGLNEYDLKVAFNDIDLCLRLRERGYRIVWTPYAELYHHESASRGDGDKTLRGFWRLRREIRYMQSRWGHLLSSDPYYNPNLTLEYEDFSLAYPPRLS